MRPCWQSKSNTVFAASAVLLYKNDNLLQCFVYFFIITYLRLEYCDIGGGADGSWEWSHPHCDTDDFSERPCTCRVRRPWHCHCRRLRQPQRSPRQPSRLPGHFITAKDLPYLPARPLRHPVHVEHYRLHFGLNSCQCKTDWLELTRFLRVDWMDIFVCGFEVFIFFIKLQYTSLLKTA